MDFDAFALELLILAVRPCSPHPSLVSSACVRLVSVSDSTCSCTWPSSLRGSNPADDAVGKLAKRHVGTTGDELFDDARGCDFRPKHNSADLLLQRIRLGLGCRSGPTNQFELHQCNLFYIKSKQGLSLVHPIILLTRKLDHTCNCGTTATSSGNSPQAVLLQKQALEKIPKPATDPVDAGASERL